MLDARRLLTILAALAATLALAASACGNSESSSSGHCCLNGEYYECPDADAASECSLDDGPGECEREASKDDECDL